MKKTVLILSLALWSCALLAQDTLTGWTFPSTTIADSLNANLGTTQNKGYDLRFQWVTPNDTTVNSVFFTDGSTSYAAATTGWENGADTKYWSIKFKASGYGDFKVSSKQKSIYPTYDLGPGAFKLQWKISGGTYEDVPNGTINVANDWTTGAVDNLPVPITNQGSSSIYLRWLSTSNNDYLGSQLTAHGINMIDDILVTGRNTAGTTDIVFTNRINVYPVPNHGTFCVDSKVQIRWLSVTDLNGKVIFTRQNAGFYIPINLGDVRKGTYFLEIGFSDSESPYTVKVQVD